MKAFFRTLALICIAWLFVFMSYRWYESIVYGDLRVYGGYVRHLIPLLHLLLCTGSFIFQLRKFGWIKKYKPIQAETALDSDFLAPVSEPLKRIPKVLKVANVLFGIWICFLCIGLIHNFISNYDVIRVSVSLLALYSSLLYCLVFIVGGGAVKFFSVDENSTF